MSQEVKTRYSDKELEGFKAIIMEKLEFIISPFCFDET